MEAETPEHLSELENGDQQQAGTADEVGDNTSKQVDSPQQAAGEEDVEQPSSSGRQDRHSKERRGSRHSNKPAAEDSVASGTAGLPCMSMNRMPAAIAGCPAVKKLYVPDLQARPRFA